jgi:phage shock protein A
MAISVLGSIWQVARRVEEIFQDVAKLVQGLAVVRDELRDLERRIAALENREELLIEKTKTAASVAASSAVTQHLVDMSRRIGALEAGSQKRIV